MYSNELYHHGILGMKWGVRRYQNKDGTLTDAGRKRYGSGMDKVAKYRKKAAKYDKKAIKAEKSAHRFWARDAEAAYAKYSKYKYKAEAMRTKADRLEKKMQELAGKTKMSEVSGRIAGSAAKKSSILDKVKTSIDEKNRQKKLAEAAEKRKATIAQKKAHEEEKQEALRSGDAEKISKFQSELSNDELRAAVDRIRLTETLKSQTEASVKTGMDKTEELMSNISRVRNMAEQGVSAWNTAAKIHNSFVSEKEKWPVIDGSGKKEDRGKIKKAIESGDPEKIAKYKDKLTVSETSDAVKTINNWKAINDKADAQKKAREDAANAEANKAKEAEKARDTNRERMFQQRDRSQSQDASKKEQKNWDEQYDRQAKAENEAYKRWKQQQEKSSNSKPTVDAYYTYESEERAQKLLSSFGKQKVLLLEDKQRRK